MTKPIQIYLIPGFFGFSSLGDYSYFFRVSDTLSQYLKQQYNVDAQLIRCATKATSSIHRRAQALAEEVVQNGGLDADSIHLIGHSTGGLDMRLLLTPGVKLFDSGIENRIATLTQTAFSISTPHHGTPLASFFTTMQGRHILQLITTLANNKAGRKSIFWISKLIALAARADDWLGRDQTFLDHLVRRLLQHVTVAPDDPIWEFLESMKLDQGAIIQLTPEAMHLYNAAVSDRENVRYFCVMNTVPPPEIKTLITESTSPTAALSMLLFSFLHTITGREHPNYKYPFLPDDIRQRLHADLNMPISPRNNDGISPLMSQYHGELIHVTKADHLDIVGQFDGAGNERFTDWLVSGAQFSESAFQAVWHRVADEIVKNI
ncbi:MAG: hypothetical protein JXX14_10815 [Deltaproteobacteria bacterium]|nr:hypothetical protein [Deltaproteobacteria bacterium]